MLEEKYLQTLNIFQIIDIMININTAYYDKGLIVGDRMKILKNYYDNNFLTDIMYFSKFLLSYIMLNFYSIKLPLFSTTGTP